MKSSAIRLRRADGGAVVNTAKVAAGQTVAVIGLGRGTRRIDRRSECRGEPRRGD